MQIVHRFTPLKEKSNHSYPPWLPRPLLQKDREGVDKEFGEEDKREGEREEKGEECIERADVWLGGRRIFSRATLSNSP